MNDDPFMKSLHSDWFAEAVDSQRIMDRFASHRRWARVRTMMGVAGIAVLVGCLAWAIREMFRQDDILFAIAALVFAGAIAIGVAGLARFRREAREAASLAPHNVVAYARERTRVSIAQLSNVRWSAAILLAAVAGLWVLAVLGRTPAERAIFLSVIWGGTALASLCWQRYHERSLQRRLDEYDRLIGEYDAPD